MTPRGEAQLRRIAVLIRDRIPDLAMRKEVKVRIPAYIHIRLHSVKILTGKEMGDVVTEALEQYFAARP